MQEKYDSPIEDSVFNTFLSYFTRHGKIIGSIVGIFMFMGLGIGLSLGLLAGIPFFGFGTILTGPIFAAIGLILGGLVGLALGLLGTLSLEWFNKTNHLEESHADPVQFSDKSSEDKTNILAEYKTDLIPILDNVPNEIWKAITFPFNRKTVNSLMMTCSFFAKNKTIADIRNNKPWFDVVAGGGHTLLLTQQGHIWVCGDNSVGQLGLQRFVTFNGFKKCTFAGLEKGEHIIQMAAGYYHSMLLTSKGNLWTFGSDDIIKAIRLQTNNIEGVTHDAAEKIIIEKCANISLDPEERITQVEAGYSLTFLLTTHGKLFARGGYNRNILGSSNQNIVHNFKQYVIVDLAENEYIRQIVTGAFYTLLLTDKGSLFAYGDNPFGQLGLTDSKFIDCFKKCILTNLSSDEHIVQIAAGHNHTLLLTNKGNLWGWGSNKYGQLSLPYDLTINNFHGFEKCIIPNLHEGEYIVQVTACDENSFLLTNNGNVLVCGRNDYGQLGLSNNDLIYAFEKCIITDLIKEEYIVKIVAGRHHTLLITNKSNLFACGRNELGQLGLSCRNCFNSFEKCTITDIHEDVFPEHKEDNSSRCLMQ